jgi:chemotaxis signal transduction protein
LLKKNRFGIFVSLIEMASPDAVCVLVFQVGDLACGVPAESAREVLPTAAATRIPGAHPVVDGLANIRGSILTVLDGHRLLDRAPLPQQEGVTIVVDLAGRTYGLRVGQVHDLFEVREEDLEPGEDLVGVDPALVRAVGQVNGQHFILLDLESLLEPVVGT